MISDKLESFIQTHIDDDPYQLMLQKKRYADIDILFASEQIQCRKLIRNKLPEWYKAFKLVYPSRLSTEQCSSEITAKYKQRLVVGESICDLTGGLGIDSYYFSFVAEKVIYVEQSTLYCEAAKHNFNQLKRSNIDVWNGDCVEIIHQLPDVDTFYIDPARRTSDNNRIFAIDQYEPNVLVLKDQLLRKSKRVVVKVSPMIDITASIRLLPEVSEVHINSVRNECKEVLFILEHRSDSQEPIINCSNFTNCQYESFTFLQSNEMVEDVQYTNNLKHYLYEPNSSILKGGGFNSFAIKYGLQKLHPNSHLYTSVNNTSVASCRSRVFIIVKYEEITNKLFQSMRKEYPTANISIRNSKFTVEEFRKKCKIKEGGDVYIFVTTLYDESNVVIICKKA